MTATNPVWINLGRIVRQALKDHSRTQRELGEFLGISQSTVQRRLSGEIGFTYGELIYTGEWLDLEPSWEWLDKAEHQATRGRTVSR
ncbi:helix-turn-helix domain-containing protein [Rhodococcus wratislaviensis]|uniref:HTH cro/C1-type domain-containing protein n=1 Tax=Rhodococcus wratislaviensis NBRC 100605 TaxID=1219028 RepID=X0Q8Y1_RHOWR|nr:helix-turn-helix transcriptional regulator [Rhodococcus wratislaviensis]GAF47371.1 hypothetical protein RW1_040_00330 [Rhodococcus wratislaviensis NBRC 100605]